MLLLHACTYAWIPTYPRETRKTGQERKGKERKGKERKGKERKGMRSMKKEEKKGE
jgi:hypothetical protein